MSATIQTDFDLYFEQAKYGMPYDRRTMIAESYAAENVIAFGKGVVLGTDPRQVKVPTTASQQFRGIALAMWPQEQTLTTAPTESVGQYNIGDVAAIARRGAFWVIVSQDVLVDDQAYLMHTVAPGSEALLGTFRKDDMGGAADLVATAVFRQAAISGTPALLEINLP